MNTTFLLKLGKYCWPTKIYCKDNFRHDWSKIRLWLYTTVRIKFPTSLIRKTLLQPYYVPLFPRPRKFGFRTIHPRSTTVEGGKKCTWNFFTNLLPVFFDFLDWGGGGWEEISCFCKTELVIEITLLTTALKRNAACWDPLLFDFRIPDTAHIYENLFTTFWIKILNCL